MLAGSLKLFLRELPEPLLPYCFHPELVRAALGLGAFKGDIVASLEVTLFENGQMLKNFKPLTPAKVYIFYCCW